MATTDSAVPVNGTYGHQSYDATNFAANAANNASSYGGTQQPASGNSASTSEIPKDEVGWYFVEQYYTTLSKSPDRLYLFYNKRSQYVSGTEEDKIQVCVGQKAINDRIKELDFQDTKVRVTNVDSQGSDANIVIQVIGEISNRGQPHKRFVQTFVLAEQTNGYFVLNDIFRYLAEEPEEEEDLQNEPNAPGVQEPVHSEAVSEGDALKLTREGVAKSEEDLVAVDEKLEETVLEEPAREPSPAPPAVNGTPAEETVEETPTEEAPAAAAPVTEEAPIEEPKEPITEEPLAAEKPKDPAPTPVAAAQKPAAAATPSAPPKPAAPRTWASLAASAHKVATPAVPAPATSNAPSQPKATTPTPSQPAAAPPAQPSVPARESSPDNSQGEAAGWQSVTGHKKEQTRAQNQAPATEDTAKRGYIKNVYSQVEEGALRSAMSKFGEISYLDISRQKNCAFVDFKTLSSFNNAVSSNPHHVNGVDLIIEERRMRPQSYGQYPRGGRGRGGPGNQSPRGGFNPRGGRGGPAQRGPRAAPQDA